MNEFLGRRDAAEVYYLGVNRLPAACEAYESAQSEYCCDEQTVTSDDSPPDVVTTRYAPAVSFARRGRGGRFRGYAGGMALLFLLPFIYLRAAAGYVVLGVATRLPRFSVPRDSFAAVRAQPRPPIKREISGTRLQAVRFLLERAAPWRRVLLSKYLPLGTILMIA